MIKAVIFDVGGVLIDQPDLLSYCSNLLDIKTELLNEAYQEFHIKFTKGLISESSLWKEICSRLNIPTPSSPSLWRDAIRNLFSEKEEMFTLASTLKNNGYKVGLLSNTETPAMEYFLEQNYPIFHSTIFSCKERAMKPERKIYEIALEKLKVKPQEAVFIDDREDFIKGAKAIGIKGIIFQTPEQVKQELKYLLIRI